MSFCKWFCDTSAVDRPFMRKGEKGNLDQLTAEKRIHSAALLISPFPTFLAPPLCPSIPLQQSADEPVPNRPAASHSQSGFSLSISSPARQKISPEAKREQGIFRYSQCRGKKSALLLDISEIKSVWLARQLWPFSTQNVRLELMECSYSQCTWQVYGTVSI